MVKQSVIGGTHQHLTSRLKIQQLSRATVYVERAGFLPVGTSPKLSICVVASTRSCAGLTPGKYFRIPNPSTTAPMLMRNVCKL